MLLKKLFSVLFGLIFAFVLCEIVLRIYNPFQSRVRGNEIILKSNYKRKSVIDPGIPGLDPIVFYSTNSLGFRGPEPIRDRRENEIRVLTVGGSTTECSLLSDDSTWSARLYARLRKDNGNVWLNNAGLDGCSTFGHLILMRDYVVGLKPDYVIFLVGINDLVKSSFSNEDGFLLHRKEAWWRKMIKRSELITLISNIYEASKSHKADVAHGSDPMGYRNNALNTGDSSFRRQTEEGLKTYIPEYLGRIGKLHDICRDNGIKPIFVTQPKFDDDSAYSWQVMLRYNDSLISWCRERNVPCIDLGRSMPKEIRYYYDQVHYTNAGAAKVADLLYPEIRQIILH